MTAIGDTPPPDLAHHGVVGLEAEARVGRELLAVLAERLPRDELGGRLLAAVGHALDCQVAALWVPEPGIDQLRCDGFWSEIDADRFEAATKGSLFPSGVGLPGRVWENGHTEVIEDLFDDSNFIRGASARAAQLVSAAAFPLTSGGRLAGVVELFSTSSLAPATGLTSLLAGLGAVLGTFLDRARAEDERRRLLGQIQTERARLDAVLRQLPQGVLIVDPDGAVILANSAADRLIGHHPVGDPVTMVRPDGSPYSADEMPFQRAFTSRGSVTEDEMQVITPDGVIAYLSVTCTAIHERDGRATSVVATLDDVTDDRRERQRLELLARSSEILAVSLEEEDALQAVARVSVPAFVDICLVDILDEHGDTHRVALTATTDDLEDLVRRALTEFPTDPALDAGVPHVLRTGEPVIYDDVTDDLLEIAARDPEHLALLRRLRPSTAVIVPIVGRSQTYGTLTFSALPPRAPLGPADIELAVELGRRTGLAVANSRLYLRERAVARQLQRSLMPPALPEIPGLDLGAAFHPGSAGLLIGGDFYDVFPVSDDSWALVVGDVCGKGTEAATVAGQVRYTARALAEERSPSEVLSELNRILLSSDPTRFCTMVFGVLHRRAHDTAITVASAGHPAPAVIGREGPATRVACEGGLLGVFPEIAASEVTVDLDPGASLVLFTDGVIEANDGAGFFGDDGLQRVLRASTGLPAGEIASSVAHAAMEWSGGELRDDVAVLVVRASPSARHD